MFGVRRDGGELRQITGPPVPEPAPLKPITSVRGWTSYRPANQPLPEVEEMPAVSPSGDAILFVRPAWRPPDRPGDSGTAHHIWRCASDGSGMRRVTEGPVHDMDPQWSPDGSTVAFTRWSESDLLVPDRSGGRGSAVRVFLMEPDGHDVRALTSEPGEHAEPSWSPDGSAITCSASHSDGLRIVRIDLRTGSISPVTEPNGAADYAPAWRPSPQ